MSATTETRGPLERLSSGRLIPSPLRPASLLSQTLLSEALVGVAPHVTGRLLDVGCGEKPYEWLFGDQVTSYIGCDWPGMIHEQKHVDVFCDACALPFRGDAFDTVLCTEVLEHVADPQKCVNELARVLKTGGHVILSAPFIYWLHEQPYDFFRYTPHGIAHLMRQAGLQPVKVHVRGNLLAVMTDLVSKWVYSGFNRTAVGLRAEWPRKLGGLTVRMLQGSYLGLRALARRLRIPAPGGLTFSGFVAMGYVVIGRKE